MEKEPGSVLEGKPWKNQSEYWNMVLDFVGKKDWNQVEDLMLERDDFTKMVGENEIYAELLENLGRDPRVELNKGVLKPKANIADPEKE